MKPVKTILVAMFFVAGGLSPLAAQETQQMTQPKPKLDVPYVPTRTPVVEAMLKLANLQKSDVLYDLGCGDGRIVVTAAKNYGVTAVGYDIDPERIAEANQNAKEAGVSGKVKFVNADLFETDLNKATVITMYLLPSVNMKLRPKILALKPGTRIVSHAFDMGDWKPEKTEMVDGATIYYWTVPGKKAAGTKAE